MENITPFDLGGLAKDLDNQLIGMRSPFGPAGPTALSRSRVLLHQRRTEP